MGKPKLRSSMKALFNLGQLLSKSMTWVSSQEAFTSISQSTTTSSLYSTLNHQLGDLHHQEINDMHPTPEQSFSKGDISSQRFFFSPCRTKSIMGDAILQKEEIAQLGTEEAAFMEDLWFESEEKGKVEAEFWEESVKIAMASMDPYMDFRASMEEMVEAHGLRKWSCLQELLQCYLRINEKHTHQIIVLAFLDLFTNLISKEGNDCLSSLFT